MKRHIALTSVILLLLIPTILAVIANCTTNPISNASYKSGYCGYVFFTHTNISGARAIDIAPNGDLLVLDRNAARVVAVWEESDGTVRSFVMTPSGLSLNHGLKYSNGYIYASSDSTVYRWPYPLSSYRKLLGNPQTVITGLPAGGSHNTRTLEIDHQKNIVFINIGSAGNIDSNSIRSRVVSFNISTIPKTYSTHAILWADGTRNEVGLRLDYQNRLWGVENGLDNLGVGTTTRTDFGDIHNTNPAEEVNMFLSADKGKFYGYPYCWTEGPGVGGGISFSQGQGAGTQWATYTNDALHTDVWCKNRANNIPPVFSMSGHIAPLDILFYRGTKFPGLANRTAIISSHGSWNRSPALGRKVLLLHLDPSTGTPASSEELVWGPTNWYIRPVGLAVGKCRAYGECLFVTSDSGGHIIAIAYTGQSPPPVAPVLPTTLPPAAAVPIGKPVTLALGQSLLTYTLNSGGTISFSLRQFGMGYIALGFNYNGQMVVTQAVLAYKDAASVSQIGRVYVASTNQTQIMESRDSSQIQWTITNPSLTINNGYSVLNFTRPLLGNGGYDIRTNGSITYVITAWNGNEKPNFGTKTLPLHTGRGGYPVNFKYGRVE